MALPFLISQAQPEPKRVVAAAANFSLKVSKLPKAVVMAWARLPTGWAARPAGLRISQKRVWLWCPPALLRTAVRIFSGTMAQVLARSSSRL